MDSRIRVEFDKIKVEKELLEDRVIYLETELRSTKESLRKLLGLLISDTDYTPGELSDIKDKIY